MTADEISLGAIVGPGRSGTTWAGTLIDSCPDVIYRFEPFHRMAAVEPEFREWFDKLKQNEVCQDDVPRLYSLLCRAHPFTNKQPFFAEKLYRLATFGRRQLWPVARLLPPISKLYGAAYSPRPGPALIFKEVTFVKPIQNLLERTKMPIVYLVRHPCATVLSLVRRQTQGKAKPASQRNLAKLLQENAPALAERFGDVIQGDDIVQRAALLWRYEIDSCVPLLQRSSRGMLLTYEQLTDDTHTQARRLLKHFGLRYAEQTERYVNYLHGLESGRNVGPRRTGWGDKYFSVYRNPTEQRDAWKSKISATNRRKVEQIVEDSPAVAICSALGKWQ